MKIVDENDIIRIIKNVLKKSEFTSITNNIDSSTMLSSDEFAKLLNEIEEKFDVHIEQHEIENVLDIVNYINEKKGIKNITLRDLIDDICNQNMKRTVLIFDNEVLTYEQLLSKIRKMAAGLSSFRIKKGTHVAILLDNCLEYIIAYFALFYIGAIPVPINTRWVHDEIRKVLENSKAKYMIAQERSGKTNFSEVILNMIQDGYEIDTVFYKGTNFYADKGCELDKLYEHELELVLDEVKGEDTAMISYTSGTTGNPKGVVLRQNDIVRISVYASRLLVENDYTLSVAPLYSAQGFLSLLINFSSESKFKMLSSFNPNDIVKEISKGQESIIHTQPTMWTMLLNCKVINFAKFDKLNTLVVSGSLCTPELAKRIERKLGCTLINVYGLIEGTSVVTMTRKGDPDSIRYNTVGRPIPGVSIKIVDEDRNEVPKGEIGELAVTGYIMNGYYNNLEMTSKVIDKDGWLYTGDLARYYDDENISIVGRCKDMVIRGGFNVYPSDIEEVIMQLPNIQTVAVIGRPNAVLGEELVAFIVPKAGEKIDKYEISRYLFRNIANYKQPDCMYIINDMPILLAGKIDKKQLYIWATEGIPDDKMILFD